MAVTINKKCLCSVVLIFIRCDVMLKYFFPILNEKLILIISGYEKRPENQASGTSRIEMKKLETNDSFAILCAIEGRNGKSICEEPDDKKLSEIISKDYLDLPTDKPYSFKRQPPELKGQIGVPEIVDKVLRGKRNGFFIESGAYDGEIFSNTLFFEIERNFNGILVEPNQLDYPKLLEKHRRVTSINACYSMTPLPTLVDYVNAKYVSGIQSLKVGGWVSQERKRLGELKSKALCFPFYPILLAMGNPVVDYFSLDVEGAELPILKTIPWDKVDIKVLSIEVNHSDGDKIDTFMKSIGYKLVHRVPYSPLHPKSIQDNIYQKI